MRTVILLLGILLMVGCTNYSAKQPYRTSDGEQLLISANMPSGSMKIWINETLIVDELFINQDRTFPGMFSSDFTNVYTAKYKGKDVLAKCKRTTHAFSKPDHECDVFIDGQYAANLFLR